MKPRRILVVILKDDYGDPNRGASYEYNYFYNSLANSGNEVRLFDFGPYLNNVGQLQIDLLREATAFQPDLIFFTLYQDQIHFATLDKLKERYTTVNWFCDDQWRFDDFSSRYCHHFTYVVTTDPFAVEKYQRIGYSNAILSQWATRDFFPNFHANTVSYAHDVTFVGGVSPFRKWFIARLQKSGISVQAYGTGWPNGRLTYEEMNQLFQRSRINLNISNSKNYDIRFIRASIENVKNYLISAKDKEQMKGRHFEIPAYGGFQLTNYVEFLEDYYTIGTEIAIYNTIDDIGDKIRYYLHHEDLRRSIAQAAYKRTVAEHLYSQRFSAIFEVIDASSERIVH